MSREISEADWKILRQLKPLALERFCQRVLAEVAHLAADTTKSAHERYLAIFELTRDRDKDLARAFNNLRRSTALWQLASMKSQRLLTEAELASFSQETREILQTFIGP